MESARINPKNPQGDYLLRPTYDFTGSNKIASFHETFLKTGEGGGREGMGICQNPASVCC